MATINEDAIPTHAEPEDVDLSEEIQDFRFLAALSTSGGKIPKRGEKDFEPHATALQSNTLAASRQAMQDALSIERTHHPRGYTVATYHPETNMAYAHNPKGVWMSKMGHVQPPGQDPISNDELRGQRLWLLPEEALYLIERGSIDIRWPSIISEEGQEELGVPMSLQAAYAMFLGDDEMHNGGLTFERYSVYTALRRGGYTVIRAPSWNSPGPPVDRACYPTTTNPSFTVGLLDALSRYRLFARPRHNSNKENNDLVGKGFFRDYSTIYQRLALIDAFDPTSQKYTNDATPSTLAPFRVAYHVYKPSNTTFKKTAPGTPDFRLAVIDARKNSVPTLQQLSDLMTTMPYESPPDTPHFYAKLKHGYKNVVLAVVDQGVTSYLRFSDAAFMKEKLYERSPKGPGAKRGGKQGNHSTGRTLRR